LSTAQQRFHFTLETESTSTGEVLLLARGLPAHRYKIICGKETKEFRPDAANPLRLKIPAGTAKARVEIVRV
jgi:hypothetical protein